MKIVVTDGYTLNPGDLSWESIASLGDLTVHDRTPENLIWERCKEADVILTNKVPFSEATILKLPSLRLISVLATGYNIVDTKAATAKGIVVCNVPAYGTASVAQHALALLLELSNGVGMNVHSVASGEWSSAKDWCYSKVPITELAGKTLGIVGFGNIGQQLARIADALGMKILYYNRSRKQSDIAESVDLKTLFRESDFISLHCPLTADNNQFVNKDLIGMMKKSAYLINTARGQLINENDLAEALNSSHIAGAALDVLSAEPPPENNPLLSAKNCIVTPHNAWMSKEARSRIMDTAYKNLKEFMEGLIPANQVNKLFK